MLTGDIEHQMTFQKAQIVHDRYRGLFHCLVTSKSFNAINFQNLYNECEEIRDQLLIQDPSVLSTFTGGAKEIYEKHVNDEQKKTEDMVTNAKFIGLHAHSLIEEIHRLESKCNFIWNYDLNKISTTDMKEIISSISDRGRLNLLLREMRSSLNSFFDPSAQATPNIPSQKLEDVTQQSNGKNPTPTFP